MKTRKKPICIFDQRQLKICIDHVKNPLKGYFLGGPTYDESKRYLIEKFGYTEKQINKLESE
jgi:hypothetical protein